MHVLSFVDVQGHFKDLNAAQTQQIRLSELQQHSCSPPCNLADSLQGICSELK